MTVRFLTGLLAVLVVASLLSACSTTKQAREVELSGFLRDYSILHHGTGNEPLLWYANARADCTKYGKVMIDPVTLWGKDADSSLGNLSGEDRDMLRHLGYQAMHDTFTRAGFTVVSSPGRDVLRARAAITEAEKANVLLEDVSVVAPYASAAATVYAETKGQGLFTGDMAWEAEYLDSLTGERLAASVDKRVGLMDLRNTSGWDFLREALSTWKDRGVQRLQMCRQTGSFLAHSTEQTFSEKIEPYRP